MGTHRQPLTRFTVLAFAVSGHVLLLMLLSSARPPTRATPSISRTQGELVFVEIRRPTPPPQQPQQPRKAREFSELSATRAAPERSGRDDEAEPRAPGAPSPAPPIDWRAEAEHTAKAMAPQLLEDHQRRCREADPRGPPPPGCGKREYNFEWKPEPSRVGVSGGLPYVRIGKRCVVGLGFFGCGIGKLPEPNGELFEDMDDPDRPRSSVPDVPEGGIGP